MAIKDRAYYQNLLSEMKCDLRRIDYHIRQAERYKKLYELTKNVRWYGWLNRLAYCRNKHHCIRGSKLARRNLTECAREIDSLTKFLNEGEDSA